MKTSERKCPHCEGALSKYEDPLAIKMLADSEAKTHPNPKMLKALQMAYQYHHVSLGETDQDSMSYAIRDALLEAMGKDGYKAWIKQIIQSESRVPL